MASPDHFGISERALGIIIVRVALFCKRVLGQGPQPSRQDMAVIAVDTKLQGGRSFIRAYVRRSNQSSTFRQFLHRVGGSREDALRHSETLGEAYQNVSDFQNFRYTNACGSHTCMTD